MAEEKDYSITMLDGFIRFKTSSFLIDKGSVLHSGIYNRELTSSMAAGFLIVAAGLLFAHSITAGPILFLCAIGAFVVFFVGFRTMVFKEPVLDIEIDSMKGTVAVSTGVLFSKKTFKTELSGMEGLHRAYSAIEPANPDGVRVVEGIALQHFTVIPGFGQTSEFHSVLLRTKDGREITLYSSANDADADAVFALLSEALRGACKDNIPNP